MPGALNTCDKGENASEGTPPFAADLGIPVKVEGRVCVCVCVCVVMSAAAPGPEPRGAPDAESKSLDSTSTTNEEFHCKGKTSVV